MSLTATVARYSRLWRAAVLAVALALLVNGWPLANPASFVLPDRVAGAADDAAVPAEDALYKKALDHPWLLQARLQLAKLPAVPAGKPPLLALASAAPGARPCAISTRILRLARPDCDPGPEVGAPLYKTGPPRA
jgi:hypothetical protein